MCCPQFVMFCKILKTVFMKSNKNKALEKHLGVLSDWGGNGFICNRVFLYLKLMLCIVDFCLFFRLMNN